MIETVSIEASGMRNELSLAFSQTFKNQLISATARTNEMQALNHTEYECETVEKINKIADKIEDELCTWYEIYKTISNSAEPLQYFNELNVSNLKEANRYIRNIERRIKLLSEDLHKNFSETMSQSEKNVIKKLKRIVAQLRSTISGILEIRAQLISRKNRVEELVSISQDAIDKLILATNKIYKHEDCM